MESLEVRSWHCLEGWEIKILGFVGPCHNRSFLQISRIKSLQVSLYPSHRELIDAEMPVQPGTDS